MRHTTILLAALSSLVVGTACTDGGDHCDEDGHCEDETELFEAAYNEGQLPGKADGTDCSGVRVPDRNGFNKRVALTFDDGPNPVTTPQVIQILKRHGAPATFFINGSRAASAAGRQLAAQIAADPDFILANHSQHHTNLAQQTPAKVVDEIMRTDAAIRQAGETPRYFRFPFGSSTCSTMQAVRSRGYISTGWHIDSADWCFAAGDGVCKRSTFQYVPDDMRDSMTRYVMSQVRSYNGGILLFHDIHQATADELDALLTTLTREGYTFVRLDDHAAFPRLHGVPATPTRFIGDRCTSSAECGFTAGGQSGRCHVAGFCTTSCQGSCPDQADRAPTFCIADAASSTAGICVSKPAAQNQQCLGLPGTTRTTLDRFIGSSSAAPATSLVCAPR